ncbi:30S ribosomal protein S12 methylthiotransferase RimO [Campylobacter sp. LR264d]|uniref:30S ribosomal protein S12 methylthiotransferase RimO n=1 Tax=unclassified Campylobacter TaxID=2593542 RepID=UPI001237ECFB|nr:MULTISPECIES: 30S ribosomal protein S12 methylthiotransferase RimO [unclassified Campylobacter]KAA6224621.1 30S ribosomal protein S12 methylthiotransferase RimO [Campylobacter sp. LR185c]KAA6234428.1 30S ribosomal protein S12 methylthiotransferase RimO [Campylobacter sp. LR264d]KAA8603515.1 30S ribosomal protein S12 methylthiotransferase RimO [Campylobacter sp. LR185c]
MAKLFLQSLGCNKNLVDSEIMLGRLSTYDLTQEANKADILIVNTCGFIKSAKEESIQAILNLHSIRKQDSLLIVTGCLMQRYKDELIKALPEVDLFTGVGDYEKIDELIINRQNLFSNSTYLQSTNSKRIITGSKYHAFIKISEGCNQNCSFCAIPTFKGRLQSRSIKSITEEVEDLVSKGFKDFSFIAQDSSSFLLDKGEKNGLIKLIKEIEKIKGVLVARILYLYPSTTTKQLIKTIIDSKIFANYFDMPLQHINENMLKIMQRKHSKKHILELLSLMRKAKDSFLRTGFIVGHPGEKESEFNELCEFIANFNFDRISLFAYSKEENTRAFDMVQIPRSTINSRLKRLEKIVENSINKSFENRVGQRVLVICNGQSSEGEFFIGAKELIWDRDIDGEILINESLCGPLQIGEIYECEILEHLDKKLLARAIKKYEN